MDWDGDTSDENSGDDCSDDEVSLEIATHRMEDNPGLSDFFNTRQACPTGRLLTKSVVLGDQSVHPFRIAQNWSYSLGETT